MRYGIIIRGIQVTIVRQAVPKHYDSIKWSTEY